MTSAIPKPLTPNLAETGWRIETTKQPDGTLKEVKIPLTELEFLHPKEGYRLPNSTFHDDIISDTKDLLTRRYINDSNTAIFSDLIIKWGIPNLGNHCPDICVVFGILHKQQNRTEFVVEKEGVSPKLIIEVVSPHYRKIDRENKVREYAIAGVQEYLIIDQRKQRGQAIEEVIGYRLEEGRYLPITPDEEGRILSLTVGLKISLVEGKVKMEDAETGEVFLTSCQLEQRLIEAQQQTLEAQQQTLEAQQLAARLAERLRALGINPEEI